MLTGLHIHLSAPGGSPRPFLHELIPRSPSPLTQKLSSSRFVQLQPDVLNYIWILPHNPTAWLHVISCHCHNAAYEQLWQNPHWKEKATRYHARGAMMQTPESLQPHKPLHQIPPTAKSNHNYPSYIFPWNLSHPTKMKNEEYYDFTHSCQKDINRIQLQRRLDTEILLCAVNKRQTQSRRAALMWCYEGECIEEQRSQTFTL